MQNQQNKTYLRTFLIIYDNAYMIKKGPDAGVSCEKKPTESKELK